MATLPIQAPQNREDSLRVIALNQAVQVATNPSRMNTGDTTAFITTAAEAFYTFLTTGTKEN